MSTFADTNLGGAVVPLGGQDTLQRDLDGLEHWAVINGMKFGNDICWILHLGWSKTWHEYTLGEEWQAIIRPIQID